MLDCEWSRHGRYAAFDTRRAEACAQRTLARHGALLDRAAERAPLRDRSRRLCAGLGVLAEDAALALGARSSVEAVGGAAALLSLLTKVDDEVIDAAPFHGGPFRRSGHRALRHRVRRYLAPTLDSLLEARAVTCEPRCTLAAEVGRQLRALAATPDRLAQLHEVIASGWETQVRAVDVLSRHPQEAAAEEVAYVTAAISADWLLMITMIGGLPSDAARPLSPAEMDAFSAWGWHIQRADALADFLQDAEDGLANSWAGHRCHARFADAFIRAVQCRDASALDSMLADCAPACLPSTDEVRAAARPLRALGNVACDLGWIHSMLVGRWRSRGAG